MHILSPFRKLISWSWGTGINWICRDNQRKGMLVSSICMRDPSFMSSVKPEGTYSEFHPVLIWKVNCFQTMITTISMCHHLHVEALIGFLLSDPFLPWKSISKIHFISITVYKTWLSLIIQVGIVSFIPFEWQLARNYFDRQKLPRMLVCDYRYTTFFE